MEISDKVRSFLMEKRFAVLATVGNDGLPHQSVMWYALEGDEILMNTLRGRVKDENIQRDPRVSICIEDEYSWVTLVGEARLIEEQAQAQADIRGLAIRYHGEEDGNKQADKLFAKQERITIRIKINRVVDHV